MFGMVDRPLKGKRVLVTRAEEQAEALASKLESLGAETVKLPLIRIEPSGDETVLDAAIEKALVGGYDWVVFTSVHGVRTFLSGFAAKALTPRTSVPSSSPSLVLQPEKHLRISGSRPMRCQTNTRTKVWLRCLSVC